MRALNDTKVEIQKEIEEEKIEMDLKILQGGLNPLPDPKKSNLARFKSVD